MNLSNFFELAQLSGGIIYIMALLLLVALAVIIERFWAIGRMQASARRWVRELKGLRHVDARALQAKVDADAASPAAQVVAVALQHDMDDTLEHFDDRLEEALMDQAPRIDRGLWMLDTIVTLAPLLGLLGTIIGMFHTFSALSNPSAQTQAVTGGVGEALLVTAVGLFIAVTGLVAFNALNQRARLVMHELERIKLMLSNRMYPHYRATGVVANVAATATTRSVSAPPASAGHATVGLPLQQQAA